MDRMIRVSLLTMMPLALWGALVWLIVVTNAGSATLLSSERILASLLLIAAPAATFIPLGRWMEAPLYDIEGITSWASFGYILTFLQPASPPTLAQFLLILLPLTVAIATVATCCFYLLGMHFYRKHPRRRDIVRARREGYLTAFSMMAMMLLYSVGTLTITGGLLLIVIVVLIEVLALSRTVPWVRF